MDVLTTNARQKRARKAYEEGKEQKNGEDTEEKDAELGEEGKEKAREKGDIVAE